jgi:hypothetical protein
MRSPLFCKRGFHAVLAVLDFRRQRLCAVLAVLVVDQRAFLKYTARAVPYSAAMQYFAVHSSARAVSFVLHLPRWQPFCSILHPRRTRFGTWNYPLFPCFGGGFEEFLSAKSHFAVSAITEKGRQAVSAPAGDARVQSSKTPIAAAK